MDTILLIVTGLSLAMAGAMAVLLVRVLREERRRTDARVALLEQLAAEPRASTSHRPTPARVQHGSTRLESARNPPAGLSTEALAKVEASAEAGPTRASIEGSPRAVSQRPAAVTLDDFDLRPGSSSAPVEEHEIFHEHQAPSAWPRRFVVVGAMAAVMAALFFGWSATQSTPVAPLSQTAAQADEPSLELLSLQHARQNGTLVISGLVQNPRSAAALAGIQATVQLFDPDGRAVATGRAPLDFTTLAPGDESPFVIRVPVSSAVARYRVGFRGENDRVLGHVDRRNSEAVARKQGP